MKKILMLELWCGEREEEMTEIRAFLHMSSPRNYDQKIWQGCTKTVCEYVAWGLL